MTETAKITLNRIVYAIAGALMAGLVTLGVWAYKDRVDYDSKQDTRIEGVDRDLQGYKLKVAETMPSAQDLELLRASIKELSSKVDKLDENARRR